MSNIPVLPNQVPTPLEVQDRSIRSLNKVVLMQIDKSFESRQDKVRAKEFMIQKIMTFVTILNDDKAIPVPKKYSNEFDVPDYLAKSIATHIILYAQIGFHDPFIAINVFIADLNINFNRIVN